MRVVPVVLLLASSPALANNGVPDRLTALEARVAELEADRDACRADLDALTEASAEQSDTIDGLVARFEGFEAWARENTFDDDRYQQLLADLVARIPVYEPEWTNFNEHLTSLDERLGLIEETVENLSSRLDCLLAWLDGGACDELDADTANGG